MIPLYSRSATKDYHYFGGGGGEDSNDVWKDIIPPATGNSQYRDPSNTFVSCWSLLSVTNLSNFHGKYISS